MIFFVTDFKICSVNETLKRIREAAIHQVDFIMLRGSSLKEGEYEKMVQSILQVLENSQTELVVCHQDQLADKYDLKRHNKFLERTKESFSVSTHSEEEIRAVSKEQYALYGHIFETNSKLGLKPRSKHILKCHGKSVAIGGIKTSNAMLLEGYCQHIAVMSEWLLSNDIEGLIKSYRTKGY